jgi:hypothetical protein
MTPLQLTATAGETARSPQSGSELVESSKQQPSRFPLDLSSPTRSEGGLFPSLKSQAKKSEYENATDDERKRDEVAEAVDVRREHVRQIRPLVRRHFKLRRASQSGDDSNEDGQNQDCPQGPLLGSNNQHSLGNGRNLCHNRRRKFHFGLTSDVESTGWTIFSIWRLDANPSASGIGSSKTKFDFSHSKLILTNYYI